MAGENPSSLMRIGLVSPSIIDSWVQGHVHWELLKAFLLLTIGVCKFPC